MTPGVMTSGWPVSIWLISSSRREDRVRFWEAIAGGVSSEDAAGVAGVSQAVGSRWFRQAGGMPPICLAPVSERYLSFAEREEIAILCAQGAGVRAIARQLGRSPSTISRELRRNASTRTYRLEYRALTAKWRASRPKVSKLASNDRLRAYVADRLSGQIARPDGEQVAGPVVRFASRRHGLWVPETRPWSLTCRDASRLSERHPVADSSTSTEMPSDQLRHSFGHPHPPTPPEPHKKPSEQAF